MIWKLLLIGMLLAFAGCTAQAQSGDPCDAYSEMAGQCGGNIVTRYARRVMALKSGQTFNSSAPSRSYQGNLGANPYDPNSTSNAACPIGSYPWRDKWGTPTCKSFSSGQNTVTQGSLSDCPAGSHPWVDEWGTRICQSFNEGTRYYDTSKGCPTGTYKWVDNWGNKICKAF
jgi:hypothetical protein